MRCWPVKLASSAAVAATSGRHGGGGRSVRLEPTVRDAPRVAERPERQSGRVSLAAAEPDELSGRPMVVLTRSAVDAPAAWRMVVRFQSACSV
jgi:hypothetical protein